ncbi:MAG: methionyl-tRNA formyltransferase [Vicinamibacterales bacterium]|jgi:methionyl-tRNA formyltransferase
MALRVAFFGTPQFAVPTLEHLVKSPHQVVGVITQPDRPRGRGQQVSEPAVKALAVPLGLPVLQPERLARDQFEAAFTALHADIGVVAAYGKILPDWLLATPRLGLINVHASLLPRHRGASPVHRAVIGGDAATGVTIMRVVKALDAGPMLSRVIVPIGADDTTSSVEADLAVRGAELLVATLDDIEAGRATEIPQDESQVTYAPKLTKAEGLVDWRRAAGDVHNLIRGLWPWPHAYAFLHGTRYILHRSRISPMTAAARPGTILAASAIDGLHVACGEGAIEIVDLQLEGKRVMSARDAMASRALTAGAQFSTT